MNYLEFPIVLFVIAILAVRFFPVLASLYASRDGEKPVDNRAEFIAPDGAYIGYASFFITGMKDEPYYKIVLRNLEIVGVTSGATLSVIVNKVLCDQFVWSGDNSKLKHRKELSQMPIPTGFTKGSCIEIECDGRVILSGVFGS